MWWHRQSFVYAIGRLKNVKYETAKPDHSVHATNTTQQALSTQLYSFASTPSLPDLDEKSKSQKVDLSLRGVVRRVSTHVYVRCMRAGTLLITHQCAASVLHGANTARDCCLSGRDFCPWLNNNYFRGWLSQIEQQQPQTAQLASLHHRIRLTRNSHFLFENKFSIQQHSHGQKSLGSNQYGAL